MTSEPEGISPRERLARVAKPSGKLFRRDANYTDMGDGETCPIDNHGRMYLMSSGRMYCPHQSHDREREKPHG